MRREDASNPFKLYFLLYNLARQAFNLTPSQEHAFTIDIDKLMCYNHSSTFTWATLSSSEDSVPLWTCNTLSILIKRKRATLSNPLFSSYTTCTYFDTLATYIGNFISWTFFLIFAVNKCEPPLAYQQLCTHQTGLNQEVQGCHISS